MNVEAERGTEPADARQSRYSRPTIYDVARVAGVSTASVSRTLSGHKNVSRYVKECVREAIASTGYKPHLAARGLVKRRTWLLGIIVPDISNPFFPGLIKAIQYRAEQEGYGTLLSQVIGETSFVNQLELLGNGRVDGIITVGLSVNQLNADDVSQSLPYLGDAISLVCLDRDSALPGSTLIAVDHRASARMMVSYLVSSGHTGILYIDGPEGLDLSMQRRLGYEDALRDAGIALRSELVLRGDLSEASGYNVSSHALDRGLKFTAVFAANDLMAIGAMSALRNAGLSIPQDVSVAGFDDITISAYVSPALTTVHQPVALMGAVAAEVAVSDIEDIHRVRTEISLGQPAEDTEDLTATVKSGDGGAKGEGIALDGEEIQIKDEDTTESMADGMKLESPNRIEHDGSLHISVLHGERIDSQLQYALSSGDAYETINDGRRVITFRGSLAIRGSTSESSKRFAPVSRSGSAPGARN